MEAVQRRCPACAVPLIREDYESAWALRCPSCRGALVSRDRLDRIKRDPERHPDLLKQEARAEHAGDTGSAVGCPRCHAIMKKKVLTRGAAELHLDYCPPCDLYWLDGGELALVQLLYETSAKGQEARALQRRALQATLSPERQARFQAALDRLPDDLPDQTATPDGGLLFSVIRQLARF